MKEKELTLKEAEQIVDTMYQNKFINSGTIEDNNIHLGNMDNIEFTDLENASIYLLREEIRLKQELQRKDNEIKQLQEDIVNHIKIASEYKEQMIIKDNIIKDAKEVLLTTNNIEKALNVLDKIKELENGNK